MKKILINLLVHYLEAVQYMVNIRIMRHKLNRYQHLAKGCVLDVGAGDRPYKKYFKYIDQYLATNTKRHYSQEEIEQLEPKTDYWVNDGASLPVGDESFDAVLCFQVLSVISEPAQFFKEAGRILKKDGILMLSTDFLYPKWSEEDYYRHTDANLRRLAKQTGFEVLYLESFGGFWTMLHSNLMRYIRNYPDIIKQKKSVSGKLFGMLFYIITLLALPLISLWGMMIYVLERNKTKDFGFTMNNMVILRKM
ncbi:MAG: class I SAM-dependent methyltransferase [Bacteroidales bacterium]|nr:class I SAM-dependent methyltransferase [Bacteroidales bacterium]